MIGICLLERARTAKPDEAQILLDEAWTSLGDASARAAGGAMETEHGARIKSQAQLRGMQVLQQQKKWDHLLTATTAMLPKHRGTVEELILLSLVYHTRKQLGEEEKAREVRDKMREAFDALKSRPRAFTEESGEYSRKYWEETWFKSEK